MWVIKESQYSTNKACYASSYANANTAPGHIPRSSGVGGRAPDVEPAALSSSGGPQEPESAQTLSKMTQCLAGGQEEMGFSEPGPQKMSYRQLLRTGWRRAHPKPRMHWGRTSEYIKQLP